MREATLDSRYRISQRIAEGGFGAIYRATDLAMGREVALKVLHRELAADPCVVARFHREAEALARLRDPHTITMFDVGITVDGTHYIVMELLRGANLYQQFRDGGRMPWRRVVAIARGVCSSLREAHAAGIVHRDLKPANIHLEVSALQHDFVKVLDFGIAKLIDADSAGPDLTLAGQMIGTFDYMSPEQLIGGGCTGRSDVFSLAVVVYELIAGERPFGPAQGPAGQLMAILTAAPVPLADRAEVPAELADVVMRALSRDPEDRMDIDQLDDAFARILAATPAASTRLDGMAVALAAPREDIGALIDETMAHLDDADLAEGTADDEARFAEGTVEDTERFDDDDEDETWVGTPPHMTMLGIAPMRPPRLAVGSRPALPPVHTLASSELEMSRQTLASSELETSRQRARGVSAGRDVVVAAALGSDSQMQTARQPARPVLPVVRLKTPVARSTPTPSELALPPPRLVPARSVLPRLAPVAPVPQLPQRLATGTAPIVNKRSPSPVRYLVWAVVLFGIGFGAALTLASL